MSFPLGLGIISFQQGVSVEGILSVVFGMVIVLYNASSIVVIRDELLTFYRYGFKIWSIPFAGAIIKDGKGGDFPLWSAFILSDGRGNEYYIIKSIYSKEDRLQLLDLARRAGSTVTASG